MTNLPVLLSDTGQEVIDLDTGEAIALEDAAPAQLARISERLSELARQARDARALVDHELSRRLAAFRERKLNVGSHTVEAKQRREWDPDATWAALSALLDAGLVSNAEVDEAMPEKTARVPDGRKLNVILTRIVGEDPTAAQALAQARNERTYLKVEATAVDGTVAA